jgi:FeS assembly SUF system protein
MSDRPFYDPSEFYPGSGLDPEAATSAQAGTPLAEGVPVAAKETVIEALKTVYDPATPVDTYELGLIYELDLSEDGATRIVMTLTAPGCPVAGEMPGMVANAAAAVDGVGEVLVELTWDPPWTPERMSEDAKLVLGIY